jgi:hemerythrin
MRSADIEDVSLFVWKEEYGVNFPAIDTQHKRWFALAEKMHQAAVTGKGKEVLSKALSDFIAYTTTHFAAEENLMLAHDYPGYGQHKVQHDAMAGKLTDFQRQFEAGRATLTLELLQFLKAWLSRHISTTDQDMGAYLSAEGLPAHRT